MLLFSNVLLFYQDTRVPDIYCLGHFYLVKFQLTFQTLQDSDDHAFP